MYVKDVWMVVFLFKQKTAYERRISDWSSDVCSSDLASCRSSWARPGSPTAWRLRSWVPDSCCLLSGSATSRTIAPHAVFSAFRSSICLRSEEHTSELQSLMRSSYAVFCLKKKKHNRYTQ